MLEISLFDVLIKVFLEFIILLAPDGFFLLAFRYLKEKSKKKKKIRIFIFVHFYLSMLYNGRVLWT